MDVLIWGGFLGVGKTSLLMDFAHYVVDLAPPGKTPLIIVENEIGEVGIDDKILQAEGLQVRELFAGCCCCQAGAALTATLNEIAAQTDPYRVIIETTGIAVPTNIVDILLQYGKGYDRVKIVLIVDAERWLELHDMLPVMMERQISGAHKVIINKVDLVTDIELQKVIDDVQKLNGKAALFLVSAKLGVSRPVWREVLS